MSRKARQYAHKDVPPSPDEDVLYLVADASAGYFTASVDTGLDFVILTDHAEQMDAPEFAAEVNECTVAQSSTGATVIMGQEYAVNPTRVGADGHYLAYSPNYYIDPTGVTHQSIIKQVNAAGALGVIAHPYHKLFGWSDWAVHGFTCMEIMSDGVLKRANVERGTLDRWDVIIEESNGHDFAGLGGSDAHLLWSVGDQRTFVYTGGSKSESAILDGIKKGRTVISNGIFVTCEVDGTAIGGTRSANFGDLVEVRVDWPTGQNLRNVTAVHNGQRFEYSVDDTENLQGEMTIPGLVTGSGSIRGEASNHQGSDAYIGPVFLDMVGSSGMLDLALVVDTTGSMWDDIAAAKSAAGAMASSLEGVDARVSIIDYRDFPRWPYGSNYDYEYHDVLGFTSDQTEIAAGIQRLYLGNGMDWRESVYSGLMHTIDGSSLGGWRVQPNKFIILIGDAPPHDPEPFTGYVMQDVLDAAYAADPITIYPILVGGDSTTAWYFNGLAEGSGGQMFTAANSSEVVDAVLAAIGDILETPSMSAEVRMEPQALNLKSQGQKIAARLTSPAEFTPGDVAVTELLVNGVVQSASLEAVSDGNTNGRAEVNVFFDRAALEAILDPGEQTLIITGRVNGQPFPAVDTIAVIDPGY